LVSSVINYTASFDVITDILFTFYQVKDKVVWPKKTVLTLRV